MSTYHVLKYSVSNPMTSEEWESLPDPVRNEYIDWWVSNDAGRRNTAAECIAKIRQILANYEDEL